MAPSAFPQGLAAMPQKTISRKSFLQESSSKEEFLQLACQYFSWIVEFSVQP
jgi:hypothetical protein